MTKVGAIVAMVLLLLIGLAPTAGPPCRAQEPVCIVTVDPKIVYFDGEGGKQEVTVIPSSPDCSLKPLTAYKWLKVYSSTDAGRRVVIIEAGPTSNFAQRLGSVMVGTAQIEVVQRARAYFNW